LSVVSFISFDFVFFFITSNKSWDMRYLMAALNGSQ